jgi:aspartate racemase
VDNNSRMRTLGILGGLGPESTIDYYRSIIASMRERRPKGGNPHLVINSLDVDEVIQLLNAGRVDELADYITQGVEALVRAGAEIGCIAANTPHLVFDEVERRSEIPLISIVRATAEHAKSLGLEKVGLLGTGFTMRASFYPEELQRAEIDLVTPTEPERQWIHQKYIGELLKNQFLPSTKSAILGVAQRMKSQEGVGAVVLAGTELPLLLRESEADVPFLDSTLIHVKAIVEALLA